MNIVIYSKPNCSWCVKAKELMNTLHLKYDEKKLDVDFTKEQLREMKNMSDWERLFLPQIFVNGKCLGGYEDFAEWCDNHGYGNGQ